MGPMSKKGWKKAEEKEEENVKFFGAVTGIQNFKHQPKISFLFSGYRPKTFLMY